MSGERTGQQGGEKALLYDYHHTDEALYGSDEYEVGEKREDGEEEEVEKTKGRKAKKVARKKKMRKKKKVGRKKSSVEERARGSVRHLERQVG